MSCAIVATIAVPSTSGTPHALLAAGTLRAEIDAGGARIELGPRSVTGRATTLALRRVGRAGTRLEAASAGRVRPRPDGAEIVRDELPGIVEWWRERPDGLEHGVTLDARPPGEGTLELDLSVGGALRPRAEGSGTSIAMLDEHGVVAATYGGLVVLDAEGQRIPSTMTGSRGGIRIAVDDASARYPLVVDPLFSVEEATLAAAGAGIDDQLGYCVSMSRDGSRVIVGAPYADTARGSDAGLARIFVRTGTSWTEEAVLVPATGAADDHAGFAVAISADGTRALVGVPYRDAAGMDSGNVLAYVRAVSTWTLDATLAPLGAAAGDHIGASVALSGDGLAALVGAPDDDNANGTNAGAAYSSARTASWSIPLVLTPPSGRAQDRYGASVALADDGLRAVIGAPGYDGSTGAVADSGAGFVSARATTAVAFAYEATLRAAATSAADALGYSVAISATGDRVLAGAPFDDTTSGGDAGSASVFLRTGTAWAQETSIEPAATAGDYFGFGVGLSGDGGRAVLGAPGADWAAGVDAGTAALFERTGTAWSEAGRWTASGAAPGDGLGNAVALSPDGTRGVAGVSLDTASTARAGTARVYRITPTLGVGAACTIDVECTSRFCFDGRCCTSDCSGGAGDCRACSVAAGGALDGTCTVLLAGRACRASAGACDPAEACDGASVACPSDVRLAASTTCRTAAGGCDVAEVCDGSDSACPGDALVGSGVVCRSDVGDCDVEERCTGADAACPADVVTASGATCRDAVGPCDQAETCDGAAGACPADTFLPATTVCDATIVGPCDAPDHCTGASGNCPPAYLTGSVCRAVDGACDTEDVCSGTAAECPADAVEAAGMTCRASSGACDPAEACDGVAGACPADVTECPMPLDGGGRDAGAAADTGSVSIDTGAAGADAGAAIAATGCACSAVGHGGAPRSSPRPLGGLAAVALAARLVRARRRPHHALASARGARTRG